MTQPGHQFGVAQKCPKVTQSDECRIEQCPACQAKIKREHGGNNEEYAKYNRRWKIKPFRVCLPDCRGLGVGNHGTSLQGFGIERFEGLRPATAASLRPKTI